MKSNRSTNVENLIKSDPFASYESKVQFDEDENESSRYQLFIDVLAITIAVITVVFIIWGFATGYFIKVYTSAFTKTEVKVNDPFELK